MSHPQAGHELLKFLPSGVAVRPGPFCLAGGSLSGLDFCFLNVDCLSLFSCFLMTPGAFGTHDSGLCFMHGTGVLVYVI